MGKQPLRGKKHQKAKQRRKKRFAKLREDMQLKDELPTVPDGAVRDERVDPASQGAQPLPGLIGAAIRNGWQVPEEKKPALVDEMMAIVEDPEVPGAVKVMAHNALRAGDKDQWERDHPEAKNSKVNVEHSGAVGVAVFSWDELARALSDPGDEVERAIAEVEAKPVIEPGHHLNGANGKHEENGDQR